MIIKLRQFLWRILGFDYHLLLKKTDFTFIRDDKYTLIGKGTYDNGAKVWRWSEAKLQIGNYCSIANNVNFIMDEGHHTLSQISNYPFLKRIEIPENDLKHMTLVQKEGITVGNDVWIGMGSYIMPGVNIGNGAVIAANSVVTKNVEDYHVVAGTPAKTIKVKYNLETIQKLNNIAWWDWKDELVKERVADFYLSIDNFINKYSS